jgi:predicted transposase/invertase (TIGR01784 family)
MNKRDFLPVKSDVVFRLFFADERNQESLIGFLKAVLKLPEDDYHEIEIADPHLLREYDGDKLAIIDVKLITASGKIIHIEIQLKVTPELKNRIILYDAKLIAEQIGSGDDYDVIKKIISIVITDEALIEGSERYHHRFILYDRDAGIELSDIIEINTLELGKLPKATDGTELYDWAKFIDAETVEELNMIAERNPVVGRAVVRLRELSADERARDLFERREKARRDQASREKWARQQGENAERAKWQGVVIELRDTVADKDAAIADKDAAIADKDAAIADMDAEIERLRDQLKKQNSENN